jgi:hypothetical protein
MKKVMGLFLEMLDVVRTTWAPVAARYNVDLTARIAGKSEDFTARILDISESGCFAAVDHKLEVGTLVGVDFKYTTLRVHAVAVVVRNTKKPAGCGFMFVASTRGERNAIRNLIRKVEADEHRAHAA